MKIVFFGTSKVGLPTLQALHSTHEVLAVVTAPDAPVGRKQILTPSPVAELATSLNIKTLKPEKVKNNPELLQDLKTLGADVFVVVSYGKILPKELIDSPPLKTLNIHFSLLPKYRGAAPIQAALLAGDTVSGTSIFILDELLDHGPILAQKEVKIAQTDTFTTLSEKMALESTEMLLNLLPAYEQDQVQAKEQNHELATKAPMIHKEDGLIDWNLPAVQIYNRHRAYFEWPGIYTHWQGKLLKILSCSPGGNLEADIAGKPVGLVLTDGRIVCGSNTCLQVQRLQLEGSKETDIRSFFNGHHNFTGSVLGK